MPPPGRGGGGSLARCAARVLLTAAVPPLAVGVAGVEPGGLVWLATALASGFEVAVTFCNTGKKPWRPTAIFPLQLGALYAAQVWLLILQSHTATTGNVVGDHPAASQLAPRATPAPPAAAQVAGQASSSQDRPPDRGGLPPFGDPDGFVLDAPPEALRWTPRTMSVVLPCAEEREYALNTVKSIFDHTPSEVLKEIVVVDDGSNPPLGQTHLPPAVQAKYKVKIVRHDSTQGLIKAKKSGGDAAVGDVISFFDCHVAPQPGWEKDFFRLIGENYRRMVIPQITALDVDTWSQKGNGGGMSKCYVTWDGDFKWGGNKDDMYMGMLSGGLLAMSRRWWIESGGYDDQMLGWGGENIDQGIRMWVCGGEIVAAPNSQVAHMWRLGSDKRTVKRYKSVGDSEFNRARAIHAWSGEFSEKLYQYNGFHSRRAHGGPEWIGDMGNFDRAKEKLNGCRPFAWYLRRFKGVYEDAGLIPNEIFMIKDTQTEKCLYYQGRAGTSGQGKEGVVLRDCEPDNDRFMWHLGNQRPSRKSPTCCSGLRAWNTDQCFEGQQAGSKEGPPKGVTGICEISGRHSGQQWEITEDGFLKKRDRCMSVRHGEGDSLVESNCVNLRTSPSIGRWVKFGARVPLETELYRKWQRERPDVFEKLNRDLRAMSGGSKEPGGCKAVGGCKALSPADGSGRCLDDEAQFSKDRTACVPVMISGKEVRKAETGECLDTASDDNAESWVWYSCHGGINQQFETHGASRLCSAKDTSGCFSTEPWSTGPRA